MTLAIDPPVELGRSVGNMEAGQQLAAIQVDSFNKFTCSDGLLEHDRIAPEHLGRQPDLLGVSSADGFGPQMTAQKEQRLIERVPRMLRIELGPEQSDYAVPA